MRIAYLLHFYPPAPCGGAGYYTANLAEAFCENGADVGVLCVDQWGEGNHYLNGFTEEIRNGVMVRRLRVNWRKAPRPFDWQYDSPVLGEQARDFLTCFRPDIVHVGSCYTLSARPVLVAREMDLPIVLHLHDYWTVCARLTFLHKDNSMCSGPDTAWKCQQCLLAGTKSWKLTRAFMNDASQRRLFEVLAQFDWATRLPSLRGMLGDLQRRLSWMATTMQVGDTLVAPSAFARDVLVRHGVDNDQIRVIPCGNRLDWVRDMRYIKAESLRIGFLGNVIPIKGVHVLTDAYKTLLEEGHSVHLTICGNYDLDPAYYQSVRNSSPSDVLWRGKYERSDLQDILGSLDVVVVPSICYETQGIVVQEAFAAGVPVVVSDGSSLTEAVENDVNGLYFRMGSADDLAVQLRRLLQEPDLLQRLRAKIPPVRTLQQDVNEYTHLYTALIEHYSGRRPLDITSEVQ